MATVPRRQLKRLFGTHTDIIAKKRLCVLQTEQLCAQSKDILRTLAVLSILAGLSLSTEIQVDSSENLKTETVSAKY